VRKGAFERVCQWGVFTDVGGGEFQTPSEGHSDSRVRTSNVYPDSLQNALGHLGWIQRRLLVIILRLLELRGILLRTERIDYRGKRGRFDKMIIHWKKIHTGDI
jgi:hypothetical protein